jgi:hypothetical protein
LKHVYLIRARGGGCLTGLRRGGKWRGKKGIGGERKGDKSNKVTLDEQSTTSVEAIRRVRRCITLKSSSSTTSFHSSVFKRNLKSETASDDTHKADWE